MTRIATIAWALVGCWAAVGHAETQAKPDGIEFKLKAEPGQVSRTRIVVTNVGTMEMPGPMPPQKFSQTVEQAWVRTCRKINSDNSIVYDMGIERYAMKMNMGGRAIEFDSATFDPKKAANPFAAIMGKVLSAMTTSKFTTTVGPGGRPVKVEGLSKCIDNLIKEIGDEADAGPTKRALEGIRAMFDDDSMTQDVVAGYQLIPPKGQARVGDSWEHKREFNLPVLNMSCESQGRYELVGIETFRGRECAKIRIKESCRMVPQHNPSENTDDPKSRKSIFDRMDIEMTSSGGQGIGYWDYGSGELVQLRQTGNLTIKMTMRPDPDAENDEPKVGFGPMVQKLKNSLSIELIEENAEAGGESADSVATASAPASVAR